MFGMGTGSGSSLEPPGRRRTKCKLVFFISAHHSPLILEGLSERMGIGNERRSRSIERLGPVSSTRHGVSRLHTRPINVVVYDGS